MKYKLLKDLPRHPAGTVFEDDDRDNSWGYKTGDDLYVLPEIAGLIKEHKDNLDWFEPIEDKPKRWRNIGGPYYYVGGSINDPKAYKCEKDTNMGCHENDWEQLNYFSSRAQAQAVVLVLNAVFEYVNARGDEEAEDANDSLAYALSSARKLVQENQS